MAKQSIKARNKLLRRRRDGLRSKCHKYGQIDGIDLALIIYNREKCDYYTYRSGDGASSFPAMSQILAHSKSKHEIPSDLDQWTSRKQSGAASTAGTGKDRTLCKQGGNMSRSRSAQVGIDVLYDLITEHLIMIAAPPTIDL